MMYSDNVYTHKAAKISWLMDLLIETKLITMCVENRLIPSVIFQTKMSNIHSLELVECKDLLPNKEPLGFGWLIGKKK